MVRHVLVLVVLAGCSFATEVPPSSPQGDAQQVATDAPGPDASPEFLCMQRYGTAKEFVLCSAMPMSCTFYVDTDGGSCGDLCAGLGGTCVEAHDGNCGNISSTVRDCTFTLGDQVCTCRP
jgi:hypothetical protein